MAGIVDPKGSAAAGVTAGLLLVVAIIVIGACLGYKGREAPKPVPSPDRTPVIVIQP